MKRVGIITYHAVCNFGAQLQTISTVGYLKRNGYEPIVIYWYPKDLDEIYQKSISPKQYKYHIDFAEQNMPLTRLCQTESELLQVIEENNLDAIILGSDALFKYLPQSARKSFSFRKLRIVDYDFASDQILEQNPFWGSFISKLKKIIPVGVFSVSSQNSPYFEVNKQEYDELKRSLEQFKYITVRDEWTKQMVQYFMGNVDIPITPDPVFSFNQNNCLMVPSKKDLLKKYNIPDNYVLLSFRTNKVSEKFIEKLKNELEMAGYTSVAFPHPEGFRDFGCEYKISLPLSPLDWYYLIKYSAGYIGERMHPIVVALHNAVPFFSFDEYGTIRKRIPYTARFGKHIPESSKIYHILSKSNLLDNVVSLYEIKRKPTAQFVIEKLLSFDKEQASKFSEKQVKSYEIYMDDLLRQLLN